MGLRIQNNIMAMNAQKQLNISNNNLTKSLERLSSGYRINRAADDAAGLAISQSFRAEIASFKVASRNTAEANALLQVAEGSMDQMGNILTRLKELATQAASGNAAENIDKINSEANQLVQEFDRIATSTQYAGRALLTGQLAGQGTRQAEAGSIDEADALGQNGFAFGVAVTGAATMGAITGTIDSSIAARADGNNSWTITATANTTVAITNGGITYTGTIAANTLTIVGMGENQTNLAIAFTAASTDLLKGETLSFNNLGLSLDNVIAANNAGTGTYTFSDVGGNISLEYDGASYAMSATVTEGLWTIQNSELGITINLGTEYNPGDLNGLKFDIEEGTPAAGSSMNFQIGSLNEANNRLTINLADAQASVMGLTANMLDTDTKAQAALTTIDNAISSLTDQRGNIGAYMNRLNYAAANLETIIENVQAAESIIRDVDMAAEMTNFVKNQILMQAGTAMLAQANMAPQSVLGLLG